LKSFDKCQEYTEKKEIIFYVFTRKSRVCFVCVLRHRLLFMLYFTAFCPSDALAKQTCVIITGRMTERNHCDSGSRSLSVPGEPAETSAQET